MTSSPTHFRPQSAPIVLILFKSFNFCFQILQSIDCGLILRRIRHRPRPTSQSPGPETLSHLPPGTTSLWGSFCGTRNCSTSRQPHQSWGISSRIHHPRFQFTSWVHFTSVTWIDPERAFDYVLRQRRRLPSTSAGLQAASSSFSGVLTGFVPPGGFHIRTRGFISWRHSHRDS